ncbi:cytochrome c [Janthinobacterium aquaticum]|uniref:cytochrome c n=1 Tax=Janthinobacterium sp. FT58W TaxID=2654254 RepID=UPI0012657954|nr:cytochrome c [Janthinobacterium sp. FT58W]KAB8038489.1 c-type cytochrome [Janthinobacterium sp. FT58W]
MHKLLKTAFAALLLASAGVTAQAAPAASAEQIARGKALAIAGDCMACHTQTGKPQYSGGHAIASPLGAIYATNITPSVKAGIGSYTLQQFSDAVRLGKRADGAHLYPAMPYTAYAKLNQEDVAALYAYFMHGVVPDDTPSRETRLPFPFNLRFSMALWNALYLDDKPYQSDPARSVEWNRGAYLVQGLAHCSTCHTPRNALMAEKTGIEHFLRGSSLGTWYAPDISQDPASGIGSWDQQAIVSYLMSGHAPNGATAGGPMLEAIDKSFSQMPVQDVQAMATYLRTLPGGNGQTAGRPAVSAPVAPVSGSDIAEMAGQLKPGQQLYRNNCAACHQNNGDGMRGLPALRNHPMLHYPNGDNLAMAVMEGVWPEHGQGMPGFAHELSDVQVADISNYVLSEFGASKVRIDAARVKALRQGGEPPVMLALARVGMAAVVIVLLALLAWLVVRRRKVD